MAHLSLSLLGPFQAALDGQTVAGFESDKVRALLAYLALEADRPHRRETLAGLLWPERPERSARRNLNQALYNLRRVLGTHNAPSPFLLVTRQTIQFDPTSDHTLDAAAFSALLADCRAHGHRRLSACDPCLTNLNRAAALYRGGFLDGF
jgi:DNA-binding SARP family transcriptional activator